MNEEKAILKKGEEAEFKLRSIYEQYGYRQYKMSKFEEYDFYVRNKDFLISDGMITFNDTDGKLLALKPDVTLSIVKNCSDADELCKLYYSENVYRRDEGSRRFREIMQIGLECIGEIDTYHLCEVVTLAAKSLQAITDDYVLDISHMGVVSGLLDRINLSDDSKNSVIECIARKNVHDLRKICEDAMLSDEDTNMLAFVASTCGGFKEVLEKLKGLPVGAEIKEVIAELSEIGSFLEQMGIGDHVRIDFSIVNNMNYYSGVVFRGFVRGVPCGVLSGGEYGKLMKKMGRRSGAIGFAIYMDLLKTLNKDVKKYDVDTVVIYPKTMDACEIADRIRMLRTGDGSICAQQHVPKNIRYRRLIQLTDKGFEIYESND